MKKTLAITAVTVALALSLAACGTQRGVGAPETGGAANDSTTATDTMRNNDMANNGTTGTANGTTTGTANRTVEDASINGLGTVSGALNSGREPTRYGMDHHQTAYGVGGTGDAYTATNNGGMTRSEQDARAEGRYKLMLKNARVHDTDGFLLDGENSSYRTF